MLTALAIYFCALAAFSSLTALACGSVIVLAGVISSRLNDERMRTPDAIDLEHFLGHPVSSEALALSGWVHHRLPLKHHEQSFVIAIGLFLLAVLALSVIGMSLAATSV